LKGGSLQIKVNLNYISAERFWEHGQPGPGQVHVSTNVNVIGIETRGEKLSVPFVVTIGYTPSVAQVSIKGQALVSGTSEELEKIKEDHRTRRAPPPILLQAITSTSLIEATVVSRSLQIPPPIPLPSVARQPKPDKEPPSYVG
jgi:hypothetical protein